MSEEKTPIQALEETRDDSRYVALAAKSNLIGSELREKMFKALEDNDLDTAFERIEDIKKLEFMYVVATRIGMGIAQKVREKDQLKQAEEALDIEKEQKKVNDAIAARDRAAKPWYKKILT